MTKLLELIPGGDVDAPDVFCGGTPCQAFSVAGLRKSLDDARGNLSLIFCEIANAIDTVRTARGDEPAIIFWENVPGVLSTSDNAFGCFLAGLAGEDDPLVPPGGKWTNAGCVFGPQRAVAWRVLDAQYFGVAQRRRRVFVVASARKGFDPAQVLFEFDGVRRDSAPSREARQVAPTIPSRSTAGGGLGTDFDCDGGVVQVCPTLRAGGNQTGGDRPPGTDVDTADSLIPVSFAIQAGALRTNPLSGPGGIGVQADHAYTLEARAEVQAIAFPANLSGTQCASTEELAPAMGAKNPTAVAFDTYNQTVTGDTAQTLCSRGDSPGGNAHLVPAVQQAMQVRRLTPTEAERLMGFPDGYTAIPWRGKPASECPDGPRYRALGNSWAVPNVRWIGQRIQAHLDDAL